MKLRRLFRLVFLAAALLLLTALPAASSAPVPRVQTLENGLKVLLLEDHSSPLVAAMAWVHVGGKDESEQVAGFAYYLQHLIPQGSQKHSPRQQQLEVFQAGGTAVIQSDYDRTIFSSLVPKESQDLALAGLFQQVAQAQLADDAVARVRTSLTQELKGVYDDPTQVLLLEQMRAAFPGQPYRFPFYGNFASLALLEHTTAEAFYANFYVANNMVVAVGGDIQPGRTLEKIRALFGKLKPSKALPAKPKFESGFNGSRLVVKNLGTLPVSVSLVFPTPGYRHPDRYSLAVLARLLDSSAAASLMKEGGESGRLAISAAAGFRLLEDRGLLTLTAFPISSDATTALGDAMVSAVGKVRTEGFPDAEVRKTMKAVKLEAALRRSTLGALTQEVAEAALYGDFRYGWNLESNLDKVSAEEIRRVASAYLVGDNATMLVVLPKDEKKPPQEQLDKLSESVAGLGPGKGKAVAPDFATTLYAGDKSSLALRAERKPPVPATRQTLPNGLTVILKPERGQGLVAVALQARAGFAFDPPSKAGLAQMVASFLALGTDTLSADELKARSVALGSTFGVNLSVETVEAGMTIFPEDLPAALDLVAATLRAPLFPAGQLPAIRERLRQYGEALTRSPVGTARELAREKVYRSHPYGHPSMGTEASLATITREDLSAFHRSFYRPERAVLTVVGDFEPEATRTQISSAFGAWNMPASDQAPPELPQVGAPDPLSGEFSRLVDAFPSEVVLAFPGLALKDPQFPVLRVLGTVLSARGFVDLVLGQSLAYSVNTGLESLSRGGLVTIEASVPPQQAARVVYELMLRARALGVSELSPQTLRDVRAVERGRLLREKEYLYSQASNLGFYELLGPGFGIYDEGRTLPAEMTPAALKEAAARYLDTSRLVRVTAGPPAP